MITCDYILANYDRHYRNFGAIRNVETLKWKGIAPIYDSGSSLWAKTPTQEIPFSQYETRSFKKNPYEQFMLVSDLSWLREENLIGFEKIVVDILSKNPLMEDLRISHIANKVKERIEDVIERKKELEAVKKNSLDSRIISCELRKKPSNGDGNDDPNRGR